EIYTAANSASYAERELPEETAVVELTVDTGTDRSASWGPGIALVFDDLVIKFHLRPGGDAATSTPQLGLWDGEQEHPRLHAEISVDTSVPLQLRLRCQGDEVLCDARQVDGRWSNYARVTLPAGVSSPRAVRVGKMDG